MKKITFAIAGMGNRGTQYASKQLKFPEEMAVVAMADNRRIRLDSANKYLHLPEDRLFDSAEAMLAQPKKKATICYWRSPFPIISRTAGISPPPPGDWDAGSSFATSCAIPFSISR